MGGKGSGRKPGQHKTRVTVRLTDSEVAQVNNVMINMTPRGLKHNRSRTVRWLVLFALNSLGACNLPVEAEPSGPPPVLNRVDRSAQSWSWCGPETWRPYVVEAASWWAEKGFVMGKEAPCDWTDGNRTAAPVRIIAAPDVSSEYVAWTAWDAGHADVYLYWESFASVAYFEAALRHELGHAFGFGHTERAGCTMSSVIDAAAGWCAEEAVAE